MRWAVGVVAVLALLFAAPAEARYVHMAKAERMAWSHAALNVDDLGASDAGLDRCTRWSGRAVSCYIWYSDVTWGDAVGELTEYVVITDRGLRSRTFKD